MGWEKLGKTISMQKTFFWGIALFLGASCQYGTGVGEKRNTEKEFLNHTINSKQNYFQDSIKLLDQLNLYLQNHEQSFHSKAYFDSTELILDTILYSIDFNKIALFVITKNPTYRQLAPDIDHEWYYDAFCYLAIRKSGSDSFDLKWLKNFYPINWYDKREISDLIKDMYFTEFSTIKDSSGASMYKYNLDDIRFWDSPIWIKYFNGSN